jgi:hypothetical protein
MTMRAAMQEPSNANQPATAGAGTSAPADPKALRLGYWQSVSMTIKHIATSVSTEGQRVRSTDIVPIVCIPIFAILLAFFASSVALSPGRPILVFIFLLALLYFVGGRIGVMRNFNARETHLVFNMLIAMFMVGATCALLLFEVVRLLL